MSDTPTILKKIINRKHEEVAERQQLKPLSSLEAELAAASSPRGFVSSIENKLSAGQSAVIAEIKKHRLVKA